MCCVLFFFNDTATTEIYTLSLHDALPICAVPLARGASLAPDDHPAESGHLRAGGLPARPVSCRRADRRSEEHTSELQSPCNLVCRLLLEKKKRRHLVIRDTLNRKQSDPLL